VRVRFVCWKAPIRAGQVVRPTRHHGCTKDGQGTRSEKDNNQTGLDELPHGISVRFGPPWSGLPRGRGALVDYRPATDP
jgi:hypothetical protein